MGAKAIELDSRNKQLNILRTARSLNVERVVYEINVMGYFKPGERMRMMYYSRKWHRHTWKKKSEHSYQEST